MYMFVVLRMLLLLLLIPFICLPSPADAVVIVSPPEAIVHEGFLTLFTCVEPPGTANTQWLINGSRFEELNLANVTVDNRLRLVFQEVPLEYSGTTVQCTVMDGDELLSSSTGTLLVQGILDAVTNVSVEFNSPSFIISWMAPFTFMVPRAPNTSYCVSITNTTADSSQQLTNECGILMTQYSMDLEYDPCVEYSVSIIAVNPVGNGTAAVMPFPAPGVIISDVTARAEAGDIIYEGSLLDPVCTCKVTLLVGGAVGNTTNCTPGTGSNITFPVTDLFNQILSVNVTLSNAELSMMSPIFEISTYDVQSIGVDSPAPNTVTLNATYIENSPAMGVVFALLFTDDAGSVNFNKSVYLVLDRTESEGFRQDNLSGGNYTVLAFDVEGNGRLEVRQSSPAAEGRVSVSGEVSNPPVNEINCSVDVNYTNLMVSCNFTNDPVLGYYVMLQFVGDTVLRTKETQDRNSSVVFEGLTYGGLYNVIVFPLTENGIVGTSVAFTQEVLVASPSSTTPTSTVPTTIPSSATTSDSNQTTTGSSSPTTDNTVIAAVVIVVLLLIIALCVLLIIIILCVCWRNRMRKHALIRIQNSGSEDMEKPITPEPQGKTKKGKAKKKKAKKVAGEPPHSAPDTEGPKEPMYAETRLPPPTSNGKEVEDNTTVQYDTVNKTINPQGLLYEMVTVNPPKTKTKPDDPNLVEYAELANLGPVTPAPAKPAEPEVPPAVPPPRQMSSEEMFGILVPIADGWKDLAGRMGCDEDRVDEIYTNNETNLECLRNLVDVYCNTWARDKMAETLREMGESRLAGTIEGGKQDDRPLPGQAQDV